MDSGPRPHSTPPAQPAAGTSPPALSRTARQISSPYFNTPPQLPLRVITAPNSSPP